MKRFLKKLLKLHTHYSTLPLVYFFLFAINIGCQTFALVPLNNFLYDKNLSIQSLNILILSMGSCMKNSNIWSFVNNYVWQK